MRPEAPIFILSDDNRVLDVRADVADAQEHAGSKHHLRPGDEGPTLLYFDGLARPLDVRPAGRGVELTVALATSDPWQVRARAVEAIRRRKAWLEHQPDPIELDGRTVSKEAVAAELAALDAVSLDTSFVRFTQDLLGAFDVRQHSGSFLHNLFHR